MPGEDDVGGGRGELAALRGVPGLDDDRVTLRGARDGELALDGEVLPLVTEGARGSVGGPGVPQLAGGGDELGGPAVGSPPVRADPGSRGRSARSRQPPRRKFSPVKASEEVTTFQAARPSLRWSRVASRRASSYGSLKVALTVAARPSRSVTAARALSTVRDSGRPTTSRSWMRPLCSRSRSPSARKKKSNLPRSAVRARCSKEENSIWLFERGSLQTVVLFTPGKWAARCICFRVGAVMLVPPRGRIGSPGAPVPGARGACLPGRRCGTDCGAEAGRRFR